MGEEKTAEQVTEPPFEYKIRWAVRFYWFVLGTVAGSFGGYYAKASAWAGCFAFGMLGLVAAALMAATILGYVSALTKRQRAEDGDEEAKDSIKTTVETWKRFTEDG